MDITLAKGAVVRVVKEEGSKMTEVFVTSAAPLLNFSTFVESSDLKSGQYEIVLKSVAAAQDAAKKVNT